MQKINKIDGKEDDTNYRNLGIIRSLPEHTENISNTSSCILTPSSQDFESVEINNIIDLYTRDEDKVIKFIRKRYVCKEIYTWVGQTLLAVHPYEDIKLEDSPDKPSINSLVYKAWFRLQHGLGKANQAIVITGESGAGKTFSTSMALKYIAKTEEDVEGNPLENILWQIWCSVPLLGAFGSATTSYNTNSSRFGKLLQLQYVNGNIQGAYIETYLLEKSRVAAPNPGDSNFTIFRQVLDNLDDETLSYLYLRKDIEYKIAPNVGLKTSYADTVKALEILNITELDKILIVLSVILNLGNVNFELIEDVYNVSADSYVFIENVAKLLHIPTSDLTDLLCNIQFCSVKTGRRNSICISPCRNKEQCEERRNCVMKFLYEKLFLWLVKCINMKMYESQSYNLIGLLDIYGFECMNHNTFEQLCINYANERLQQYFLNDFLKKRNEQIADGFNVEFINISEYGKRIRIIDGEVSIFSILNEECAVKRFNNDLFVKTRLSETLRGNEHFITSLNDLDTNFSIKHFAGVVKYDTKTMLSKNRDKVPEDVINFLKNTNFTFLQDIINDGSVANGKTLVANFKKSLDGLVEILNTCDVHYIKCLKPNPYKKCEFFDEDYFRQQMLTNGVFEILKLNDQKYSVKYIYEDFLQIISEKFFKIVKLIFKDEIHFGKKYIYLTERGYYAFYKMHQIYQSMFARKIQFCWRSWYNRRLNAVLTIQKFYRKYSTKEMIIVYEKCLNLSKKSSEMCISKKQITNSEICVSKKIERFLENHQFDVNFEGDQLSLPLEKVYNTLKTKPFRRVLFCGDRIVSYNKLAEIPLRFHVSKTCMRYSYLLPKSEMPSGLTDIF